MSVVELAPPSTQSTLARELSSLVAELFPICRSITGDGVRETLRRIQRIVPLSIQEVPSGTQVFDWTVPREWNIRDAWVKTLTGERVIDFRACNLHVVNYSTPLRARVPLAELKQHLHTLPDYPTWIPYKTSYYADAWGFCVSAERLASMNDPEYDVCIDSSLEDGTLTYGECVLPGESADEVLLSCHVCHPSLCNDNLSGVSVMAFLGQWLAALPHRKLSYRLLFIPGTIGAITWLARNQERLSTIRHGLVLTGLGGPGGLVYKRSRRGNALIDRASVHVLTHRATNPEVRDFVPYGYDERQYCSPGINLSVGCLSRTPFGEYPEYHTSADNLTFVTGDRLEDAYEACQAIVRVLEGDATYVSLNPMCEPQLGKRGLYSAIGGAGERRDREMSLLWVLNLADGSHSLLDMAERSSMPFERIRSAAVLLEQHGLIRHVNKADGDASGRLEQTSGA